MTFQCVLKIIREYLIQTFIKAVPIQPLVRTKVEQISSSLYYSVSYLTLLYITSFSSSLKFQTPLPFFALVILHSSRSAFNLGYLIFRKKLFLALQKLCLFAHATFTLNSNSPTFFPLIGLDLLTSIIFTLTIDQRNSHFDSRLYLSTSILKNLTLQIISIVWITYGISQNQQQFYFFIVTVLLFLLDFKTSFYNRRFKILLLGLDLCSLFSAILEVFRVFGNLEIPVLWRNVLFCVNIVGVTLYCLQVSQDYQILYNQNPWTTNLSSPQILSYTLTLQKLMRSKNSQQISQYQIHHIRECGQIDCFFKYHHKDNANKQITGSQVLKFFRNQEIITLSKKYEVLKDYIIFNFQNDLEKHSHFRNSNSFFHRRQYERFSRKIQERSKKVATSLTTSEFVYQLDLIPMLKEYTLEGLKFWNQLIQLKANSIKIINLGAQKLEKMRKIDQMLRKNLNLNSRSQLIAYSYQTFLLGRESLQISTNNLIWKVQDNLTGYKQASPTVLVSAEKQNFLRITNANLAAVKATGYTKQQLLTVKVDALWQNQIRDDHITLAHRRARYNKVSSGQLVRSYAFLKNKFGYLVMADGFVYYFDDLKGKKWCVVLDPYLENQSVFVTNSRRELIGISQSCLQFGLRTTDQGKKISQFLYNQTIDRKRQVLIENKRIFQDQNSLLAQSKNSYFIKFNGKIDFMGKPCYFIFTLHSKIVKSEFNQSRAQAINKSKRLSQQSLNQRLSEGNQFQTSLPKFEFYYCPSVNLYTNSKIDASKYRKAMKSAQTAKVLQNQGDNGESSIDQKFQSELNIKIQYDEDIIEMRLWNNKLDFLENLQAPVPSFESLPVIKNQSVILTEEKFKEELMKREKQRPKQITIAGLFFIFVVVIGCAITAYFNVSSIFDKKAKMAQFRSSSLIFDQYQQLSELSSIILKKFYDSASIVQNQLTVKIKEIDATYIEIQKDEIVANYLNNIKSNDISLIKLDDLYRLVIKNYFSGTVTEFSVIKYFLNQLGPGWAKLAETHFQESKQKNLKIISKNIWLLCASTVLFILFWIAFYKFRSYLSELANEICSIFLFIDNRAICAEVYKYNSFTQFIDFDTNLIRQQSIQEIRQEEKAQRLYPKKLANKEQFRRQAVMLTISLLALLTYFILFALEQINTHKTLGSLFDYSYYADSVNLDIGRLWQYINLETLDQNKLKLLKQQIQTQYQKAQIINLGDISSTLACQDFRAFLVALSYSSIDNYLDQQYLNQIKDSSKKSQKQLIYTFLRKKQNIINKNLPIQKIRTSKQAYSLYQLYQFYFSKVNRILETKIKKQTQAINKANPSRNNYLLPIFLFSLLMVTATFWAVITKIRKIVLLEEILKQIPFKFVAENEKYIRYREKVKIVER